MRTSAFSAALAAGVCSGLLSACGGGDSTEVADMPAPQATREVPASAVASADAFSRYVAATLSDEGAEPLSLQTVQEAPTSDSAEPLSLGAGA